MFRFLRRVSGSFLPRPDRPWREDATSHAPTIGRKRRHSVTEQDDDGSSAKRKRSESAKPEHDATSGDASPPVEGQDVKDVTKGVKEVDLADENKPEDASSIPPEGVPLPDSPSGSPEPESGSPGPEPEPEPTLSDKVEVEKTEDQARADVEGDRDSVASSAPEYHAEEEAETEPISTNTDAKADEVALAHEVTFAVESGLPDVPEVLVKA